MSFQKLSGRVAPGWGLPDNYAVKEKPFISREFLLARYTGAASCFGTALLLTKCLGPINRFTKIYNEQTLMIAILSGKKSAFTLNSLFVSIITRSRRSLLTMRSA
jgi:hypothetical protein